jgi:hypothetical protein
MDQRELGRLLRRQCGVVSRRQVILAGGTDGDIKRLLRRRELSRVFEGVYVDHTGPLNAEQEAWAAVLFAEPAALAGKDALRAHGVRGFETAHGEPVRIVVPEHRRLTAPHGVRVKRLSSFTDDVQHHLSPPRLRVEPAALQVASEAATEDAAVAVLADVCQSGRTSPARLDARLRAITRIRRRHLLEAVLVDVSTGAYSALERRFLAKVERPHGLPTGHRQRRVRAGRRIYYTDVSYVEFATDVELDGRLGHEGARDRWADLERDIATARSGALTVRVGWLQVLEAHRLASALGQLLHARGWTGTVRPCGPECSIR